ncbi:MAG: phenylalanyl-tRNA synthetase beta chain, partial [Rickettsiales bacterium]
EKIAVGTKINQIFKQGETIIEIGVTPNRGDCLGVFGIARDLAASGLGTLRSAEVKPIKGTFESPIKTEIISKDCNYFAGFFIKNVKNAPSPKWLKDSLEAVGSNSISAIVDITNYVMIQQNQPIHAYDADGLEGNIVAKNASGENFKSLKDLDYKLDNEELIIENNDKVIGLAGIIGGLESSVSEQTTNIFLEAASFDSDSIAKTGRKLNILSDSRYRFERSVDLSNTKNALEVAANLVLEICGGEISNIVEAGSDEATKIKIDFDLTKIKQILGIEIEKDIVTKILQDLGFKIEQMGNKNLKVEVPTSRKDVTIYQDLIEEIIRIHGLDKLESQPLEFSNDNKIQKSALEIVSEKLMGSGFTETINYAFIDEKFSKLFTQIKPELRLINPISSQMSYMRPTLLAGILQNISKNQMRKADNLSLFEVGKVFSDVVPSAQKNHVCGIRIGKNKTQNHYSDQRDFDVFDIKKDLFDCLETLGFSAQSFILEDEAPNYFHPFRCKKIKMGKKIIGYFGEIHPMILGKFDVKGRACAFEIFIEELPINLDKKSNKKAFAVSDLLPVQRDFAFILEEKIAVGDLLKTVSNIDKKLISKINLFDIYQDEKLGTNKKSIALSIQIQPFDKTLTGEEIDVISQKVIDIVSDKFNGVLRDK